jgi:hypothetical protein
MTLLKQEDRKRDVDTSHNRRTLSSWLLSRPFLLVARVLEGARDLSYELVKGLISPSGTMEASRPKKGRRYQPQQKNFVVLVTITTFDTRCSGAGGHRIPHLLVTQG